MHNSLVKVGPRAHRVYCREHMSYFDVYMSHMQMQSSYILPACGLHYGNASTLTQSIL